jgi:hypothetical protein
MNVDSEFVMFTAICLMISVAHMKILFWSSLNGHIGSTNYVDDY